MLTHHLNVLGGVCGLVMCWLLPPKGKMTLVMYINSLAQAFSIYYFAYVYQDPAFTSIFCCFTIPKWNSVKYFVLRRSSALLFKPFIDPHKCEDKRIFFSEHPTNAVTIPITDKEKFMI